MGVDEVPLSGAMVSVVTRVGDTVRRTAGAWTPAVHALLTHLHDRGFRYSAIPLGLDDQGREVFTYLDGAPATRPSPAAVRADDGIAQMAAMIAELRTATADFPNPDRYLWRTGGAPGNGPRTIRHGDVGPWNMLWDGGQLVGLIDWDFGAVEAGETLEEAAARETIEEVGLVVTPDRLLGERTHPKTGRRMACVACTVVSGDAYVADTDEVSDIAWATPAQFDDYVPYGFAPRVQDYLATTLT